MPVFRFYRPMTIGRTPGQVLPVELERIHGIALLLHTVRTNRVA